MDPSVRPEAACLTGCAVPTGWGSSVYAGGVRPGDAVAVVGVGGLGSAAVQGARLAGARHIFAIDPVEFKRSSALGFGATHASTDVAVAFELIRQVTGGRMCDVVVLTMGTGDASLMDAVLALAAKRGRIVVTNIYPMTDTHPRLALSGLAQWEKQIVGCISARSTPGRMCRCYWTCTTTGNWIWTPWSPAPILLRASTRATRTCTRGKTFAGSSSCSFPFRTAG